MLTWGNTRRLLAGAVAVGVGSASALGCATQQDTAQALAIAGTAAVIIGASMAADNGQCYAEAGGGAAYCSPGLSKAARHAGTATAVAGAGVAAAGYALQPKGPDVNRHPHTAVAAPTSPYRLIRKTPPDSEPEAGSATQAVAEPAAAIESAPEAVAKGPAAQGSPPVTAPASGSVAPTPEGKTSATSVSVAGAASDKAPITAAPPSGDSAPGSKKCSAAAAASGACSEPKR